MSVMVFGDLPRRMAGGAVTDPTASWRELLILLTLL